MLFIFSISSWECQQIRMNPTRLRNWHKGCLLIDDSAKMWHRAIAPALLFFLQLQLCQADLNKAQAKPDSNPPVDIPKTDTQLIYEVLLKMLDRWNAHDIDGLMSVYWNSPALLAVIDTEQFDGWQSLYRSYKNQFRNPDNMGTVNPTRVQVKLLKPDVAFGIVSWTIKYPRNARASEMVGTSTLDIQKFDSGWKIVVLHTSYTVM
jgi:ketosteroid isomerase-like protein